MKPGKILQAVLFTAAILFFLSCGKDKPAPAPNLVGNWSEYQLALDGNYNGIVDATEIFPISVYGLDSVKLTFNSGGTGIDYETNGSTISNNTFTWALLNSNKNLHIVESGIGVTYEVVQSTSTNLILKYTDSTSSPANISWGYYKR